MSESHATQSETRSHLSRKWTLKIGVIALLLAALGLWGVYDALIRYPQRGADAAELLEYQYLQQMSADHREYQASIADPATKLADLTKRDKEGATLTPSDRAAFDWLTQLQIIGHLAPDATAIPRTDFRKDDKGQQVAVKDFDQRLGDLKRAWTTGTARSAPPLNWYDIKMQWLIAAAGLGFGAWLLLLIVMAKARVYRWDPVRLALSLPGGASLTPGDIAEFDKRKWHRLFITLKVKGSHPQMGGKDVEIDLLRYEPVEDWVLAMEKAVAPPEAEPSAEAASSAG